MGEDDGGLNQVQDIMHRLGCYMGDVHQHPQAVHLLHHHLCVTDGITWDWDHSAPLELPMFIITM